MKKILVFLLIFVSGLAQANQQMLENALSIIDNFDKHYSNLSFRHKLDNLAGIVIVGHKHPIAEMRFNITSRKIEIFEGAFDKGPHFLASALIHELRHADKPTHAVCPAWGPLSRMEACDEFLPAWENWQEGGSYVYELAFQKLYIEAKLIGYERYVRQFLGNLHFRFTDRLSLENAKGWISSELLKNEIDFINKIRSIFQYPKLENNLSSDLSI